MSVLPRYPVYVISKGRADRCLTAQLLAKEQVSFRLVVEPHEADTYRAAGFDAQLLELPFSNLGLGSIPARNWVWEHARGDGADRHWILDDNILRVSRSLRRLRVPCDSGPALAAVEDLADRYENVAVAGLAYENHNPKGMVRAYTRNAHVYSCILIRNDLPQRWRGRYNEDTDLCLQVLAAGWCTLLVNVFLIAKRRTMSMTGGNTDSLYQGDGRLRMARSLERVWPGVVKVDRRYGRPQHVVDWTRFDTPLQLRPDVDLNALQATDEYGLELVELRPAKDERVRRARDRYREVAGR